MTTDTDAAVTEWDGLPPTLAKRLTDAGITPDNVGHKQRQDIKGIDGCGPGAIRVLVRAGYMLSDMYGYEPDDEIEVLNLKLGVYEDLVGRGFLEIDDIAGSDEDDQPGTDGCFFIGCGFTVEQVAAIRRELERIGRGFVNLSAERTLANIPFDTGVLAVLADRRVDLSVPLRQAGPDVLLAQVGDELAAKYRDRITHAYWVVGYELL